MRTRMSRKADIVVNEQEENPLKRACMDIRLAENAFRNADKDLNKIERARLYAEVLLAQCNYRLETEKLCSTPAVLKLYCEQELSKAKLFFTEHSEFCQKFYQGIETQDTEHIAQLLCYQKYIPLLRKYLEPEQEVLPSPIKTPFTVKISETDLVELLQAFFLKGYFENEGKRATQKWVIEWAKQAFGIEIKHFGQLLANIQNREKSDPTFLKGLVRVLSDYNNDVILNKPDRSRVTTRR